MLDRFINSVTPAVKEVVSMMAGIELNNGEIKVIDKPGNLGDLSAIVGFSGGKYKGVVVVHYNNSMAFLLAKNIFDLDASEINDDVLDACGEVANMISGSIKKFTFEAGIEEYNVSVPTVVVGRDLKSCIHIKGASHVFYYSIDENKLVVELKVLKTE